jgi:hypothetical protein
MKHPAKVNLSVLNLYAHRKPLIFTRQNNTFQLFLEFFLALLFKHLVNFPHGGNTRLFQLGNY